MKSPGEVMGIDPDLHAACLKALTAAGTILPKEGGVYITVNDNDKARAVEVAKSLVDMGFKIYATRGTSKYLSVMGSIIPSYTRTPRIRSLMLKA